MQQHFFVGGVLGKVGKLLRVILHIIELHALVVEVADEGPVLVAQQVTGVIAAENELALRQIRLVECLGKAAALNMCWDLQVHSKRYR